MDVLEVPGVLESLQPIADFVKEAAAEAGLERREAYKLRLAVDEIATNVVLYGYERSGQTGVLRIAKALDDAQLTLCLEDTSPPYDPTAQAPPPDLSESLESRPIGGLGVFLTVQGVDDFRYEYADGHNRNYFTVRRPAAV